MTTARRMAGRGREDEDREEPTMAAALRGLEPLVYVDILATEQGVQPRHAQCPVPEPAEKQSQSPALTRLARQQGPSSHCTAEQGRGRA